MHIGFEAINWKHPSIKKKEEEEEVITKIEKKVERNQNLDQLMAITISHEDARKINQIHYKKKTT